MNLAVSINGSPRKDKGNTALILNAFIEGIEESGIVAESFYASRLKINPCSCGSMHCWYQTPGECCIQDDMQMLYPKLKAADILILATPVYSPLPGDMQNVLNRLTPLLEPHLHIQHGRTRARLRKDVLTQRIVLVSTCGWWEMENFGTLVQIIKDLALKTNIEFGGAILRPHASLMKYEGKLTKDGEEVLEAVRRAGHEMVENGYIKSETFETIRRPLISEEELRNRYNQYSS